MRPREALWHAVGRQLVPEGSAEGPLQGLKTPKTDHPHRPENLKTARKIRKINFTRATDTRWKAEKSTHSLTPD